MREVRLHTGKAWLSRDESMLLMRVTSFAHGEHPVSPAHCMRWLMCKGRAGLDLRELGPPPINMLCSSPC